MDHPVTLLTYGLPENPSLSALLWATAHAGLRRAGATVDVAAAEATRIADELTAALEGVGWTPEAPATTEPVSAGPDLSLAYVYGTGDDGHVYWANRPTGRDPVRWTRKPPTEPQWDRDSYVALKQRVHAFQNLTDLVVNRAAHDRLQREGKDHDPRPAKRFAVPNPDGPPIGTGL